MNQKIMGIIPLMLAMMFVAVFAVGDNQVAAATDTATQTATVTVPQNIAITVSGDTTLTGTGTGSTYTSSSAYTVTNTGNTRIDVSIGSGAAFTCPTSLDTIPIVAAGDDGYTIKISGTDYKIPSTGSTTIYNNLKTQKQTGNSFSATQSLFIPAGLEQGTYTNTVTYTAVMHNGLV